MVSCITTWLHGWPPRGQPGVCGSVVIHRVIPLTPEWSVGINPLRLDDGKFLERKAQFFGRG